MVVALAGLLGAGVTTGTASMGDIGGMAGMSSAPSPPHNSSLSWSMQAALFFLVQFGPVILILSIAAIALAVGVRRRVALVPVVVAGLVLYWGMYMQAARPVMYSSMVLGLAALVAAYIWSMRAIKERETQART
jgi:hypothetical protein